MKPLSLFRLLVSGLTVLVAIATATIVAAQDDVYRVRAGDTLRIEILEDSSLNRSVLVPPDGRITVPLAGAVPTLNRPIEVIQADLAQRLAPNFATTPNVFISIERLAEVPTAPPPPPVETPTLNIFVLGEVANPGRIVVEPGTTVLQLFAQMGGFTNFAATKRIQLRRVDASGEETLFSLNYKAIEAGESKNGTTVVSDGDVIVVPQRRLFE